MKLLIKHVSIICFVAFLSGPLSSVFAASTPAENQLEKPIAILTAAWPDTDNRNPEMLLSALKAAGLKVQSITPEQAGDSAVLTPSRSGRNPRSSFA
jgi:hypothetical protein